MSDSAADGTQKMSTNPKAEEPSRGTEKEQDANPVVARWIQRIEDQYKKTKENVETYPGVWASYILVYGGLGLWLSYRWRCLRKAEDRVRALQAKLFKKYEEEDKAAEVAARTVKYGSSTPKLPSSGKDRKVGE